MLALEGGESAAYFTHEVDGDMHARTMVAFVSCDAAACGGAAAAALLLLLCCCCSASSAASIALAPRSL